MAIMVDLESFTELAVHLKNASEGMVVAARGLGVISADVSGNEEAWAGVLQGLYVTNGEILYIETLLRALLDANRGEPKVEKWLA